MEFKLLYSNTNEERETMKSVVNRAYREAIVGENVADCTIGSP